MARAAVLHAVGDKELDLRDDVTTVDPGPDQVKVKIKATGVCHSDLSTMTGVLPSALPTVIGHEGAGVVAEVGDRVTGVRPGDHVVVNWTPDCGECAECLRGEPYLCMTYLAQSFTEPGFKLGDGSPRSAWRAPARGPRRSCCPGAASSRSPRTSRSSTRRCSAAASRPASAR